jgi:hypothetical protein
MAMFDPKAARNNSSNDGLPPGDYLLAIKEFDIRTSKKGKRYMHCRFVVIAGPAKKRVFFDNVSLDLDNSGAMFRLGILAEQCGVESAFDLDDEKALRSAFIMRPFKAQVNRTHENGYTNNGIQRYITGDKVTDNDRRVMQEWVTEQAENAEWSGDGGGYDDDAPHSADRPDDDIPF